MPPPSVPSILRPLQWQFLHALAQTPLHAQFYLTGGTTLAECYLQHRYSEDLDFFTSDVDAVSHAAPLLEQTATALAAQATLTRRSASFLECFLQDAQGERLELDFALDSPYRIEPLIDHPSLGWRVDSVTDIACNKLSAICDRTEPKDFVDLYFLHRDIKPLAEIIPLAKRKHVGLEEYTLAQAFARVRQLAMLPRMIKPVTLDMLQGFFTGEAKRLLSDL